MVLDKYREVLGPDADDDKSVLDKYRGVLEAAPPSSRQVPTEDGKESRVSSFLGKVRDIALGQDRLSAIISPVASLLLNPPDPLIKYGFEPLEAGAEALAQLSATPPTGLRSPAGEVARHLLGTEPVTLEAGTAFGELVRGSNLADVGGLFLADIRRKNLAQQIGTAALFDPLNVVPGVGFTKLPRIAGRAVPSVARGVARTPRVPPPIAEVSRQPGLRPTVPAPGVSRPPIALPGSGPSQVGVRGLPARIEPRPLAVSPEAQAVVSPEVASRATPLSGRTPAALVAPKPQLALPAPVVTAPPGHLLAEIGTEAAELSREPLRWFREFLQNPRLVDNWALTQKWRAQVLGARTAVFKARLNTLIDEGVETEEAIRQARQALVGELPTVPTGIAQLATPEIQRALFDEMYRVLRNEPLEILSTGRALSNALAGRSIPRIPGIKGGSAYSRLVRVFGFDMADALAKPGRLDSLIDAGEVGARPRPSGPSVRVETPSTQTFGGSQTARLLDEPALTLEGQRPLRLEPPPGPFKGLRQDTRPQWLKDIDNQIFREATGEVPPLTGPSVRAEFPSVQALGGVDQIPLIPEAPPGPFRAVPRDPRPQWEKELDLQVFRELTGEAPPPIGPTLPRVAGTIPPDDIVKQISMMSEADRQRMLRWMQYTGLTGMDLGNLVRANVATVDLSYLRQQAFLIPGHPVAFGKSFKDAFRSLWSADYAKQIDNAIKTDPAFKFYDLLKVDFLRPLDSKVAQAWQRAEDFIILGGDRPLQRLADKLPWIRISQRAYVTGMNKMNFDLFKGHIRMVNRINEEVAAGRVVLNPLQRLRERIPGLRIYPQAGETFDMEKSIKAYGDMLAEMSGRGPLGPLKELSPALNAGFFSIRLQIGRLLSPRHLFSSDPITRQAAWYNFMTAIGAFSGLILGGRAMGLWDVETDRRSSDFMKIKIGRMRIDLWGGYQQYAVLYARLLPVVGGLKTTATGEVTEIDPVQAVSRFAASKRAPAVGQVLTAWTGRDFRGSRVDRRDWQMWLEQNLPISIQDVTEAFEDQGLTGAAIAGPLSILGQGVNVHDLQKQDIALELYGIDFFDMPLKSPQRAHVIRVWESRLNRSERERIAEDKKRVREGAVRREEERRKILQDILR